MSQLTTVSPALSAKRSRLMTVGQRIRLYGADCNQSALVVSLAPS